MKLCQRLEYRPRGKIANLRLRQEDQTDHASFCPLTNQLRWSTKPTLMEVAMNLKEEKERENLVGE